MTDARTNLSKHICNEVRNTYGNLIHVFNTEIPRCVKTAEASLNGESPIKYAPNAESSIAYENLQRRWLNFMKRTAKPRHQSIR